MISCGIGQELILIQCTQNSAQDKAEPVYLLLQLVVQILLLCHQPALQACLLLIDLTTDTIASVIIVITFINEM